MKSQHSTERETVRALLEQLKPFFVIKPVLFYFDLIVTGLIAWTSLIALQFEFVPLTVKIILIVVSYSAFYRGLAFIHEAVHFNKKVKGFRLLYNLLFGFPCRVPFFIHDPHRYHHLPHTFGTAEDPEYAYLKGSGARTLMKPFLVGILSPILLIFRFGLLPLASWAFPHGWKMALYQHASTIVVNPRYKRPLPSADEYQQAYREELFCSLYFVFFCVLFAANILKPEILLAWFLITVAGSFVNIWRARISHRYDNPGQALSPLAQLRDSITVENKLFAFLWAPAGMQYHSLHHLAPQIPYHNLKAAHESLRKQLDSQHPYSQTVVTGFNDGFKMFCKTVINPE